MPASKLRPAAITRNIFIFSPFLKQAYTGLAATCTRLTSGLTQEAGRQAQLFADYGSKSSLSTGPNNIGNEFKDGNG